MTLAADDFVLKQLCFFPEIYISHGLIDIITINNALKSHTNWSNRNMIKM